MRMNPNEIGKKLGIGVRVAGRIAQQRAQEREQNRANVQSNPAQGSQSLYDPLPRAIPSAREIQAKSRNLSRAAGRGIGGFLRPFGRVGGILWLEMTGFFFGLFALYFAVDLWRTRLSYAAGPQHSRFLIAATLTVIFSYLSASSFWRANRK
jgi:hypothetical protein